MILQPEDSDRLSGGRAPGPGPARDRAAAAGQVRRPSHGYGRLTGAHFQPRRPGQPASDSSTSQVARPRRRGSDWQVVTNLNMSPRLAVLVYHDDDDCWPATRLSELRPSAAAAGHCDCLQPGSLRRRGFPAAAVNARAIVKFKDASDSLNGLRLPLINWKPEPVQRVWPNRPGTGGEPGLSLVGLSPAAAAAR